MNNATFKAVFAASIIATTTLALSIPEYDATFCNTMKDAIAVFGCGDTRCKTIETLINLSVSPDELSY